eukprot:Gregarina_sp_Poly_1__9740@NODE_61_length_16710_cov_172_464520_g52_i0_p7_GENE_NODE_61_length_16710_cov_172_464520_g52_i0NODE_61_length_16710_cov_172_464520_g52_i0_p7_ORF_typecomplete_len230_score28_15_NODE_61_length_16710_cov_172_464520_g52_i0109798
MPTWIFTFDPNSGQLPVLKDIGFQRARRIIQDGTTTSSSLKDSIVFERYARAYESILSHLKEVLLWYFTNKASQIIQKKSEIPVCSWICVNNLRSLLLELLSVKKFADGKLDADFIVNSPPPTTGKRAATLANIDAKLYSWLVESELKWELHLWIPREIQGRHQTISVRIALNPSLAIISGSLFYSMESSHFSEFPDESRSVPTSSFKPYKPKDAEFPLTEYIRRSLAL